MTPNVITLEKKRSIIGYYDKYEKVIVVGNKGWINLKKQNPNKIFVDFATGLAIKTFKDLRNSSDIFVILPKVMSEKELAIKGIVEEMIEHNITLKNIGSVLKKML